MILKRYVLKNSGDKDDAKDVFQNTLIVFYKKVLIENFELSSKISTYLFSIAKNLWLKKLRDEKFKRIKLEEHHHESEEINTTVVPKISRLQHYFEVWATVKLKNRASGGQNVLIINL